jgi:hypothetical protein
MKHILFFDGRKMVFEVQPRSIKQIAKQTKSIFFFFFVKENIFFSLSKQRKHKKPKLQSC